MVQFSGRTGRRDGGGMEKGKTAFFEKNASLSRGNCVRGNGVDRSGVGRTKKLKQ